MNESNQQSYQIIYDDSPYTLSELEAMLEQKTYEYITQRKYLDWVNMYLLTISALKKFRHASTNYQDALQEIITTLEKLENSWSWFHITNKIRFGQLVRYHVLRLCDIDVGALQMPAYPQHGYFYSHHQAPK